MSAENSALVKGTFFVSFTFCLGDNRQQVFVFFARSDFLGSCCSGGGASLVIQTVLPAERHNVELKTKKRCRLDKYFTIYVGFVAVTSPPVTICFRINKLFLFPS